MLAKTYQANKVTFPVYIQPKLDGMRAIWDGECLYSRTGKLITGVPALVEQLIKDKLPPLDGELYCHGVSLQEILSSTRRTKNIEEDTRIKYHVYDIPAFGVSQLMRFNKLDYIDFSDRIVKTHTRFATTIEQIDQFSEEFLSNEYEGLMIRTLNGEYKTGRSSDLLKHKPFWDSEFQVIRVNPKITYEKLIVPKGTPGSKPYSDGTWYKDVNPTELPLVGSFTCKNDLTQDTFEVGSGLTAEDCKYFYDNPQEIIDKKITVKFYGRTDDNIPRNPVYKVLRNEMDLDDNS